ncbi:MAG: hypothetical protein WCB15_13235 [Desulfobacterales bacterium]|jgi:ferredoxin
MNLDTHPTIIAYKEEKEARRVSDNETISMWQNLAMGSQTRCDRCMAVCPAGKESIGEYLEDRKAYINRTVKRFADIEDLLLIDDQTQKLY